MLIERARQDVKFVTEDATYSADDLFTMLEKKPKQAAAVLRGGIKIVADPIAIDAVHSTVLSDYLSDEGEVQTSGLTGLEETLIVIAVVALLSGFGVGYMKGKEDGLEEAANNEAETESEGGDGTGTSGGGDDGGDGEGGEQGEG
jgi:hypothetical protein